MQSDPLITIILTVFRRTTFLDSAIRNLLAQSWVDWECIITDDSANLVCEEIVKNHSSDTRLIYRSNEYPLGPLLNVARALEKARGKYVIVLNDDDVFCVNMLSKLVRPLEDDDSLVASFGDHNVIDVDGNVLLSRSLILMEERLRVGLKAGIVHETFDFSVRGGVMLVMGLLFRRAAIDKSWFVADVYGAYDYWISIKLSTVGNFFYVKQHVMSWRKHNDSASEADSPNIYLGEIYIYQELLTGLLNVKLRRYIRNRLSEIFFSRGSIFFRRSCSPFLVRNCFCSSLKYKIRVKTFLFFLVSLLPPRFWTFFLKIIQNLKSFPYRFF